MRNKVAVLSSGESDKITEDLNDYLDQVSRWFIQRKIKIGAEKGQAVYFSKRTNTPKPPKLYHKAINWSKHTKYLGVIPDKRLFYGKYVVLVRNKVRAMKLQL